MFPGVQKLLRLDRLERRLFGWLLLLTLVPTLTLLAVSYFVSARSLQWVGTLGPWDRVAESGRALVEAAAPAAAADADLALALEAHRQELSNSVVLARRWAFVGERLAQALPWITVVTALLLAALALWVGRRLSVQLARPIKELADWTVRLAANEPLPEPRPAEAREVREVRALREAMRSASVRMGEARRRALEAERVRAWGEMARRVAHEMKNPLTPLRLAAHRLRRHPDAGHALREPIEVIEEEVTRLDELARQFAVLGRPSAGPASDVDLRELLERLLESDVPPHIRRELRVRGELPLVRAHYDALQRAFRNLIRNAVDAIASANEGRPADAAGNRGPAGLLRVEAALRDDTVRIAFIDNGCGIPVQHAERLFEPDFTLKAGGTGLGLAVVRQAIAAHGGAVHGRNRAEAGAEFVVELPAVPAETQPDTQPDTQPVPDGTA